MPKNKKKKVLDDDILENEIPAEDSEKSEK